jgi:hypothetical protein
VRSVGDVDALADPRNALDPRDGFSVLGGVLLDVVDGDLDVLYRRHTADWLRVVPLDTADGEIDDDNLDACMAYAISVAPIA